MIKEILTAIPPNELMEILKKANVNLNALIEESEPFHGMPRWKVTLEGSEEEIEKFMEVLRLARAGG
ncbi:hypothetical protein PAP_08625 [Palaeococcus pacificus DY20341]|uniref:TIGR04140 family protein n=1 Tax=Palaeococcus pacificus DY20341 TaxID=1343739 RepID=A0A075LVF6_9EURY|nr:TIGR04140 family protein [Palaeococcus pacificus]AIF70106.1 hypothetical protein PAP_08625 [Palaeococcus pacificus DY20341]